MSTIPKLKLRTAAWLAMILFSGLLLAPFAANATAAETPAPIEGIGPIGKIVRVHTGFKFTEGPAADRSGNLFFSDVRGQKVYRVDGKGALSVFIPKSKHANGLMFNAAGELVVCQMDGQLVAYNADGKQVRTVVSGYQGKRFNAPNDLVIDRTGGIYFTDPHFLAPKPLPQKALGVYYVADGKATLLIDDLKAPNGVILSPDEKTLYAIPSLQREKMAYPVLSPGTLGKGRVFCTANGGDGLTVDTKGNLYIATRDGIEVFNPQGKRLGVIPFPQQPANVTFGGPDMRTLYVTARTSLYAVKMQAVGHVFAAGGK